MQAASLTPLSPSPPEEGEAQNYLYTRVGETRCDGGDTALPRSRRLLRCALLVSVLAACTCYALDKVVEGFIENSDVPRSNMRGAVDLFDAHGINVGNPYIPEKTCPADGSVCICTGSYSVTGQDEYGQNILAKATQASYACQPWKFRVGDLIFVDKPRGHQKKYWQAERVADFTGSPVVHNAMVTEVPPPGVNQTAENVIVTEALKGQWKKVLQNSIRTLVERYPFGRVRIARVDEQKYPEFFSAESQEALREFGNSITGQPFDSNMVNPAKKRWLTHGRFIDPGFVGTSCAGPSCGPSCAERQRAVEMYHEGGPGQWICTQVLAWGLAFPGGLNTIKENLEAGCPVPKWEVEDLQPNPGDLLKAPFLQPSVFEVPCNRYGCFIGVPDVAEWAGGTTGPPTTTTTPPPTTKPPPTTPKPATPTTAEVPAAAAATAAHAVNATTAAQAAPAVPAATAATAVTAAKVIVPAAPAAAASPVATKAAATESAAPTATASSAASQAAAVSVAANATASPAATEAAEAVSVQPYAPPAAASPVANKAATAPSAPKPAGAEDSRELTLANAAPPPTFAPAKIALNYLAPGWNQTSRMEYEDATRMIEPENLPLGRWTWNDPNPDGKVDAVITGHSIRADGKRAETDLTIKDVNGFNTTLTKLTPFKFHVKLGAAYHGGSATYTPETISWEDGTIWTRVHQRLI